MHQLVIRGATVVDGLGNEPVRADVAIRDGRISAVGEVRGAGEREIDANGLTLAPGFIDLHTHYDAQITWDRTLSPSLGVTTVVMGNCGFGDRAGPPRPCGTSSCATSRSSKAWTSTRCARGCGGSSRRSGSTWRRCGRPLPCANVAVLAGHSVIRTAVMGEAASERAEATADELGR